MGNGTVFAVEVDGANDENSFCKDGYVIKILTVNEIKNAEEQEKRRQRFQRDIKPTNLQITFIWPHLLVDWVIWQ